MEQCEYGREEGIVSYHDHDKRYYIHIEFNRHGHDIGYYVTYNTCLRNTLPDNNRCEFHDKEYAQNHPDDVMKLFYALVDDAIQNAKKLDCTGFYLPGEVHLNGKEFKNRVHFSGATFSKEAHFISATFTELAWFISATFTELAWFISATFTKEAYFIEATFTKEANFSGSEFIDEVEFGKSHFPSPEADNDFKDKTIPPIRFDYCKFRKLVRFRGTASEPLELGFVSFTGVDLTNVEFHNVKWLKPKTSFFPPRYMIIDETLLGKGEGKNQNYEDVSKIYNQLRKNYESRLLFNEASNFFIGEMEAIRKSLWNNTGRKKMASIPYFLYKVLALYGESYFLPLVIWTPALIGFFILWRFITGECSLQSVSNVISPHITQTCSPKDFFIDSFAAYFQFPRSTINPVDTIERIVSIPIPGTAFIAIRRKFERTK